MNKNNILDAYKFRYACKEFDLDKKISEKDIVHQTQEFQRKQDNIRMK